MSERSEYARLLHEGETLLWEGRPERRLLPRRTFLYFLLILAAAMMLFIPWAGGTWDNFFIALAFMGGFMLFFLMLLAIEIRIRISREIYLLTDRRLITVVMESTGPALRDVKLLRKIDRISVQCEGRSCATLYIGPQTRFGHYDWLFVPGGEAVADIIRSHCLHST